MVEETRNAIIRSARLGQNDRGILTAWLDLDYGGSGQGFGGFCLYPKSFKNHGRAAPNFAGHFLARVMEIAGVDDWSKMPGRTVRARHTEARVIAIGHIIKDDWFEPAADFVAMEKEAAHG